MATADDVGEDEDRGDDSGRLELAGRTRKIQRGVLHARLGAEKTVEQLEQRADGACVVSVGRLAEASVGWMVIHGGVHE
jgi:hypothetical protein